jgi:hypothetical protein
VNIAPDEDLDGLLDFADNCRSVPNSEQVDSDGDGFGNMCDADFNNDGWVNFGDFAQFSSAWSANSEGGNVDGQFDMNGDGSLNFGDFSLFVRGFGKAVGSIQ